jgi:3-isopropylmalate/(R)-2-methylmalate dehydratase large subunit
MTVACGDSHTSTHGAFGAIAFGIGTSQVRDVLASQSLALDKLKVRRIWVEGRLQPGVYAKDLILHVIRQLGVKGGVGYAYEFAGPAIEAMSMEERMTLCNMAIEGGARCRLRATLMHTTFAYLQGRAAMPPAASLGAGGGLVEHPGQRRRRRSFDDEVRFDAASHCPHRHLGHHPGPGHRQSMSTCPPRSSWRRMSGRSRRRPDRYMDLHARASPIAGTAGGCVLHRQLHQRSPQRLCGRRRPWHRAARWRLACKAFVVPGS